MKFIKLESRGGNYLVVASNVAWLRTAENGQTSVGIVGGQPLLVVGSIEEVAEKIQTGLAQASAEAPVAPPPVAAVQPVAPPVAAAPAPAPVPEPQNATPPPPPAPEPEPEQEPEVLVAEPEPAPAPRPAPPATPRPAATPAGTPAPARPRVASARSASQWERPASAAPKSLKMKVSSQRMMGMLE